MATINGTFNSLIAGTLSGTVATPGATGPAGPAGPAGPTGAQGIPGVGVPAGGTTGQFLTKSSNADYSTGWSTLSLAGYATESWVTAGFYPLTGNPSGFLTASALTPYLTKADNLGSLTNFTTARDNLNLGTLNNPTFAGLTLQGSGANVGQYTPTSLSLTHTTFGSFVISPATGIVFPDTSIQTTAFVAGSGLPTGGTVGQVLTKNSGTNFDASFQTLIPGDRYLTTSTTSLTIDNANKTLTVGTGLSYTPQQDVVIAYDAAHHMHAQVLTYNSGTGVMTVDVRSHSGSGTFSLWTVNVGGTVPEASVSWGSITGVLGNQVDLATALNAKLEVTTAASTYFTIASAAGKANLSGATFTGKVNLATISASSPSVNLGGQCDSAPASATNGDLWISNAASPKLTYRTGGINYNLAVLNQFNTFTGQMVINTTSSSTAALRVTQLGTGNAIEVEDSTTPDATRFVVDQNGKVGIGVAPDTTAALKVDTNGIMFGDGTTQTTAAVSGFIPGSGNLELAAYYVQSGTSSNGTKLDGNTMSATFGTENVAGSSFNQFNITPSGCIVNHYSYGTDGFGNPYVSIYKNNSLSSDTVSGGYNDYDTAVYKSFSLSALNGLNFGSGTISVTSTGITFPDSTVQTTAAVAGITDAPSDGNYYVRKDGAWVQCTVVSIYDSNSSASYNCLTV